MPSKADLLAQQVVFEVSKTLVSTVDHEQALNSVLKTMCELLDWQTGALFRLNQKDQVLICEAFYATMPCENLEKATRELRFTRELGLPGRVWKLMTPQWIPDVFVDPKFPRFSQARQDGLHSAIAFPVRVRDEFIGVFEFFNTKISEPNRQMMDAFTVVGNELGMFLERQRSDQELHLQTKRLLASENKFRIFADNINECLFISAPYLTEHYFVSNAFADIFQYSVEEVYADPNIWANRIAPEDRDRVLDYVSRLNGYEMPEPSLEYQIIRKDGSRVWLGVKIFAALDQQDGSYHICGAVQDITERKAMEKRISEFYSLISHEMKTPLSAIKGILQLLQEESGAALEPEAMQLLTLGSKECNRLLRLVNELLDIKKIEVGNIHLDYELVDACKIAQQTVESLSMYARESNVLLYLNVASSKLIRADKDRLMQVLTNLVSNAIKFSPPKAAVMVGLKTTEEKVRFTVKDKGPGIKHQDQPLLFKLFTQIPTDTKLHKRGAGLGLAISKAIIDEHGGTIGVDSREGEGSTFWFELPVVTEKNYAQN